MTAIPNIGAGQAAVAGMPTEQLMEVVTTPAALLEAHNPTGQGRPERHIRYGLNCTFSGHGFKRGPSATRCWSMPVADRQQRLGDVWLHNATRLLAAVQQLATWDIRAYGVYNPLLPLCTLPDLGFDVQDLAAWPVIMRVYDDVRQFCCMHDIRLFVHPDQYVLPASPTPAVRARSVTNLTYNAMLCDCLGADMITIHMGGVYGNKPEAVQRFVDAVGNLPASILSRLALENDDMCYTPEDVSAVAAQLNIPFVYDVHHHRIHPDGLSVDAATDLSVQSWARRGMEPYVHISSSQDPSTRTGRRQHADHVDIADVPDYWLQLQRPMSVIVESKGQDAAVFKLRMDLAQAAESQQLAS